MPDALRIAIVDGSPEIHAAIATLLDGVPDVTIVRHARSLAEFAASPDGETNVLVVDLRACMGPEAGLLGALRARYPALRLIVTISDDGREYEEAVGRLPADGWVRKTELAGRLLAALRKVSA